MEPAIYRRFAFDEKHLLSGTPKQSRKGFIKVGVLQDTLPQISGLVFRNLEKHYTEVHLRYCSSARQHFSC